MQKLLVPSLVLVIGAAIAIAGLYFIRDLNFETTSTESLTVIGQITTIEGEIENRLPLTVGQNPVHKPKPFYDKETLITRGSSEVTVEFPTGTVIKLPANSRFVAELDATRPDAIVATLLEGQISVVKPGDASKFSLYRDGRVMNLSDPSLRSGANPSEANSHGVPVIPGGSPAPGKAAESVETLDMEEGSGLTISATTPEEGTPEPKGTPKTTGQNAADSAESAEASGVLTNEDIIRELRSQTGFLQRCYLNFIDRSQRAPTKLPAKGKRPNPPVGTIVVSFTVQPNGKVTAADVVRSDFKDTTLMKCVAEVVGRTQFRPFEGRPVPVLEFPISLQ